MAELIQFLSVNKFIFPGDSEETRPVYSSAKLSLNLLNFAMWKDPKQK